MWVAASPDRWPCTAHEPWSQPVCSAPRFLLYAPGLASLDGSQCPVNQMAPFLPWILSGGGVYYSNRLTRTPH